jgi:hypothetical protein
LIKKLKKENDKLFEDNVKIAVGKNQLLAWEQF